MSSEDDGYVHRPGAARNDDDEPADGVDDAASDAAGPTGSGESAAGAHPASVDREMGARGWVVVAVLAFSLLVAPALVLWRPPGLPYWVALLALPMLPAILLGAVGVWATTRP